MTEGQIYKAVGGLFWVKIKNNLIVVAKARGNIKLKNEIYVGDFVELSFIDNEYIIEKVQQRKNILIRPYVTNVEQAIIVVAPIPYPDFYVIDKQTVSLLSMQIPTMIVLNKIDLTESKVVEENLKNQYKDVADFMAVSSVSGEGIFEFKQCLKNKLTVLSGQSAVGKSSLINAVMGKEVLKVGGISNRNLRGKNTTRAIEIYDIEKNIRIIDTCGFSSFELANIPCSQLKEYYLEFNKFQSRCEFANCMHLEEKKCGVKEAKDNNQISKERYERYVKMYHEIQQNDLKNMSSN